MKQQIQEPIKPRGRKPTAKRFQGETAEYVTPRDKSMAIILHIGCAASCSRNSFIQCAIQQRRNRNHPQVFSLFFWTSNFGKKIDALCEWVITVPEEKEGNGNQNFSGRDYHLSRFSRSCSCRSFSCSRCRASRSSISRSRAAVSTGFADPNMDDARPASDDAAIVCTGHRIRTKVKAKHQNTGKSTAKLSASKHFPAASK